MNERLIYLVVAARVKMEVSKVRNTESNGLKVYRSYDNHDTTYFEHLRLQGWRHNVYHLRALSRPK